MLIKETDETYCTYDDYNFFKGKFDQTIESLGVTQDIQNFLSIRKIHGDIHKLFMGDFNRVKQYFENFNTNDSCRNRQCCAYINYWINERIRSQAYSNYSKNVSIFSHFKDFVHYNNNDNSNNMCIYDIKYMNDVLFKKVDELYKLYYSYFEIYLSTIILDSSMAFDCQSLNELIKKYNNIINDYKETGSCFLFKKLYVLRYLIENNEWMSKHRCEKVLSTLWNNNNYNYFKTSCNIYHEAKYLHEYSRGVHANSDGKFSKHLARIRVIISVALTTVILITGFLYLYKVKINSPKFSFTALGNYLRLLIEGEKRKSWNINNETYQYEMCKSENHNSNLEDKIYNISYD
ncbi:variable surface protein [Plasmodium gonderi]|uniref:Variable surface protein n=1 Tax=Plasmodium gonderi TaxID=77519 RepID=A0A1Y1JUN6_PLAGO|nr:variable surface protein [Plasmodium gonderi]GAW84123.1 variable surface protein [Plasmodium gonderi]